MKQTFEDNRERLDAKEREQLWARVAGRTVRATGDPAAGNRRTERVGEARPTEGRRIDQAGRPGRFWRLWGPLAVGAAASVVLAVSLWNQGPSREALRGAAEESVQRHDGVAVEPSDGDVWIETPAPTASSTSEPIGQQLDGTEPDGSRSLSAETAGSVRTESGRPERTEEPEPRAAKVAAGEKPSSLSVPPVASDRGEAPESMGGSIPAPGRRPESSTPKESVRADVPAPGSAPASASRSVAATEGATTVDADSVSAFLALMDARPGEIVGRVLDQNGDPVPYANVVVIGSQWGAMSLDDGTFRIAGVPDGTYTVRAQIIGYTTDDVDDVIVGKESVALAFRVEEAPLESLSELQVSIAGQRDLVGLPAGEVVESDGRRARVTVSGGQGIRGDVAEMEQPVVPQSESQTYGSIRSLERGEVRILGDGLNRIGGAATDDAGTQSAPPEPSSSRRDRGERSSVPAPPSGPYDAVFYQDYGSNPLVSTDEDALSTFAVDVDKGAYTVARRYVTDGYLPEPASVRVEEFVNYFDPGYAEFDDTDFRIYADGAPSPFREGFELLRVGLQARTVDAAGRPPARLTFVVDVSGSMERENRLGLVRRSLGMLLDQLRPDDQVAIVAYGSTARVVLPPTGVNERERIRWGIEELSSGGSTNAEDGLRLGYGLAREMYRRDGINRILLCSDGVANVGRTGPEEILRTIRMEADNGIDLTTIGFGMGNYNDVLMEQLADQGDGAYYYVDGYEEAERVLVRELTGTLLTVARDAKIQVEFDRDAVEAYRLIGFENRDVADRDFRNDDIDAGEIGSGHSVVALYEMKLRDPGERGDEHRGLATVRLRYALPESSDRRGGAVPNGDTDHGADRDTDPQADRARGSRSGSAPVVREISQVVTAGNLADRFDRAPWRFRLAAIVAQYAEILRNSYWAQDDSIAELVSLVSDVAFYLRDDGDVSEFSRLLERAAELEGAMTAQERERRWPRLEARVPDYPPLDRRQVTPSGGGER